MRLKQTKKCSYLFNSIHVRKKLANQMLIINQNILDWIFRNPETSKNILYLIRYSLWTQNKFGWALPHKHFWTVRTSINHFVIPIPHDCKITAAALFLSIYSFILPLKLCTMLLMTVNNHQVPEFKIIFIIAIQMMLIQKLYFR